MRTAAGVVQEKRSERFRRTARTAPPGVDPPVGHSQYTHPAPVSASTRRLGPRVCLRKGCGRVYQARRWNQRYCQQPECLREVRRWQSAQRQQQRRRRAEVRQQQAAAERQRRQRRRQARAGPLPEKPQPASPQPAAGAWSRRRKNSAPFCHRPGCYEPLCQAFRAPVRYCCHACRQAVQRVLDRERKWLRRNIPAGRCQQRGASGACRAQQRRVTSVPSHVPARPGARPP